MLYILRLISGACVVLQALDEQAARIAAMKLNTDEDEAVVSVRRLDHFGVKFSPTEDGSLNVAQWDDAVLDDILASEYPVLEEAYRRANKALFVKSSNSDEPILVHLRAEFERNTEIIRQGLRLELQRFSHAASRHQVEKTSAL